MTRVYPLTVDGQELSDHQKALFDAFKDGLDKLKGQREPVLRRYREARAAGLDPQLSADERALLWLFGDVSEEGEPVS